MTGFSLANVAFDTTEIARWGATDKRYRNWPVVYVLNSSSEVYVGESLNVEARLKQHVASVDKSTMTDTRVIVNERFNKSACLDLESFLIRMFAGDGNYTVLNRNAGIIDSEYYDRETYRKSFEEIFEELRTQENLFTRTIPEIVNSDLFKLSPFKALNHDQAGAVQDILDGLFHDIEGGKTSISVVQGGPGTGKTVVAIYLVKLIEDIRLHDPQDPIDEDSIFSDFFTPGHPELLQDFRVGIVVPQQSLRESIRRVFSKTPGLEREMVLSPFDVGASEQPFDLLIVDEAHRLNHRANQAAAALNRKFADINVRLFGRDDPELTQLDWITHQSKHTIFMLDRDQSVRPADLPGSTTQALMDSAHSNGALHQLRSQMRISSEHDYVEYIKAVLSNSPPPARQEFPDYDLRFYDDPGEMRRAILKRNEEVGLSRLVAGYAWAWNSKADKSAYDIEIGDVKLRWNSSPKDWISAAGSELEVGSIHTVQGYDLNYAGVIIGRDLRLDEEIGSIFFDRSNYFDKKGMENNTKRGIKYSDADLLQLVRNIYTVLLTRGMRGTYVYVHDAALRERLRRFL